MSTLVTLSSTATKHKPALDENSFQQLLAAAYVVQQHNEIARKENTSAGTSRVLAIIAEIQSRIRVQGLNIADSAALIAERLVMLTGAAGVSISLVDNGFLDCVAEAGAPARIPGSSISSHSAVATQCLKSGHIFESDESRSDTRLDAALCRNVGVGSLIAAPVLRFGEIAGLVEVRWAEPRKFAEPELRTCRLMAGLVTGTLERSVRIGNARAATVQVPEVLPEASEPQPAWSPQASIEPEPLPLATKPLLPEPPLQEEIESTIPAHGKEISPAVTSCRMCGRPFARDEQFCGFCSMPRPVTDQAEELQSKWASLYFMQRARGVLRRAPSPENQADDKVAESIETVPASAVEPVIPPAEPRSPMWPRRAPAEIPAQSQETVLAPVAPELSFPFDERPSLSERIGKSANRYWRNAVLAGVAVTLAYCLMLAWPRPGQQNWYQALMVRLGVHKPTKVFAGTPDTRVWIDVHTQLYYCSGEDLYGKTPDGEFTTQYNAQSDGFLPASNTTCP